MKKTITLTSRVITATVTSAIRFPSAAERATPAAGTAVTATGSSDPNQLRLEP
jgi:hypothetical protein